MLLIIFFMKVCEIKSWLGRVLISIKWCGSGIYLSQSQQGAMYYIEFCRHFYVQEYEVCSVRVVVLHVFFMHTCIINHQQFVFILNLE
jgi:hypothetical protein